MEIMLCRFDIKSRHSFNYLLPLKHFNILILVLFLQHVLEHGKPHERSAIIKKLTGQIVQMSQQKFASNVIEKCLTFGTSAERQALVNEMLGTTDENEPLQVFVCIPPALFSLPYDQEISPPSTVLKMEVNNRKICLMLLYDNFLEWELTVCFERRNITKIFFSLLHAFVQIMTFYCLGTKWIFSTSEHSLEETS